MPGHFDIFSFLSFYLEWESFVYLRPQSFSCLALPLDVTLSHPIPYSPSFRSPPWLSVFLPCQPNCSPFPTDLCTTPSFMLPQTVSLAPLTLLACLFHLLSFLIVTHSSPLFLKYPELPLFFMFYSNIFLFRFTPIITCKLWKFSFFSPYIFDIPLYAHLNLTPPLSSYTLLSNTLSSSSSFPLFSPPSPALPFFLRSPLDCCLSRVPS